MRGNIGFASLPRGNGELVDQFKRASFSIVLNIAEGAGKLQQADKQRYFSIARGSVMECGALFDLLNALSHVSPEEYQAGKLLLTRIGAMLSKLCLQPVWLLLRVRSRLRARARSRWDNTESYPLDSAMTLSFFPHWIPNRCMVPGYWHEFNSYSEAWLSKLRSTSLR